MYVAKVEIPQGAKRVECDNCKSVLIYTDNDVRKCGSWNRIHVDESEWIGYTYVECPICHHRHIIQRND